MKPGRFPPMFGAETLLSQVFLTAHALGLAFQAAAAAKGVSRTQGMILGHLVSHPDGVTATRLRQWIGITAAGMSTALTDLERDGLIERTPNPHDARSLLIHLSERGYRRLEEFPRVVQAIDQRVFAGFCEEERRLLKDLLERIRLNLGDDGRPECPNEADMAKERKEEHID